MYGNARSADRDLGLMYPLEVEETGAGRALQQILLIQNRSAETDSIRGALTHTSEEPIGIVWVRYCADGVQVLADKPVQPSAEADRILAVVLDLNLPDSRGIDTFNRLFLAAQQIPILVLADAQDEDIAKRAVQRGAQDYLLKGHGDAYLLPSAVRRMIERTASAAAMFEEKERAQVTLNSIGDAVLCIDASGNVTYLNLVAESLTGWSRDEATGRPVEAVLRLIDGATRQQPQNPLSCAVRDDQTVSLAAQCVLQSRDVHEFGIEGSTAPIHDRHGTVTGAVMVFHDVSAARAAVQQTANPASHDNLTDLPNRTLLNERLSEALALAASHRRQLAVLLLDVDRFKHINDSMGSVIGDRLLRSIAERLVRCVRAADTVSRQDGDEFLVLLADMAHPQDAAVCADKMLQALRAPFQIDGHGLHITASIGIATYPEDGADVDTLIRHADSAMYDAKVSGRDNRQCFKRDLGARAVKRQSIENDMHRALERQELKLHFQPNVNLTTGQIIGVEALVRWQHPDLGLLAPADFIPIAEESGLIVPIGRWVLTEACQQARAWQKIGLVPVLMSVNISAMELRTKTFLDRVRATLESTGLEARFLELELTEPFLMQDSLLTTARLRDLKQLGLRLALDDFGTGYSSLNNLRRFPIDTLKIDRSFVGSVATNADDARIVRTLIDLGRNLQMRVVAEGVETFEQLAFLKEGECPFGQGYYFGYPLTGPDCTQILRRRVSVSSGRDAP